ncbi:P-loop containing nucleoside triphosphate hydrolase protein [Lipomyces oligophaga]|uniref:P-loop containing nucleoside triphosphate hydrolase protein n=1 Tax=Lipomyces oligophaga TaxID=45792 RepID=UPI0034D01A2C
MSLWKCKVNTNQIVRQFSGVSTQLNTWTRPFKPVSAVSPATIYALSTAPGKAALAVIRLSGPASVNILHRLTRSSWIPVARKATRKLLYAPVVYGTRSSEILDDALVLHFPSPNSFTGEDIVELQIHGGRAVTKAILQAISDYGRNPKNADGPAQVRYADPGEFTRRAFENGKMDLTQVEGLSDIIDADTEAQRIAATSAAHGYMRRKYNLWRSQLLEVAGTLAAVIDFSEEGYFEADNINDNLVGGIDRKLISDASKLVASLYSKLLEHASQIERSEIVLTGVRLALIGPPNAGKSSLLNVLARRDAAIVSDIPGTTRDVVELGLELGGYKIVLTDTAGLRGSSLIHTSKLDAIEIEGISRARVKSREADVLIVVIPVSSEDPAWTDVVISEIYAIQEQHPSKPILIALNKIDTLTDLHGLIDHYASLFSISKERVLAISCKTEQGIPHLARELIKVFNDLSNLGNDLPLSVSHRVQELLNAEIIPSLDRFLQLTRHGDSEGEVDVVLAAEEIKYAAECLGKITGNSIAVEEVLGVVFERFCVGK